MHKAAFDGLSTLCSLKRQLYFVILAPMEFSLWPLCDSNHFSEHCMTQIINLMSVSGLNVRLKSRECVCNGDTTVLH